MFVHKMMDLAVDFLVTAIKKNKYQFCGETYLASEQSERDTIRCNEWKSEIYYINSTRDLTLVARALNYIKNNMPGTGHFYQCNLQELKAHALLRLLDLYILTPEPHWWSNSDIL